MGCKKLSILAQETNHLGNVLSVVSDRRDRESSSGVIAYEPIILSATDYYPFGMDMPGRSISSNSYRFGFNDERSALSERKRMSGGHLVERTAKRLERTIIGEWGSQTHYDYGFRIYNPAIGKFLSVDPLTQSYPWYTPYQFAGNTPISSAGLDGLEEVIKIHNTQSDGTTMIQTFDRDRMIATQELNGKLVHISRLTKKEFEALRTGYLDNFSGETFVGSNEYSTSPSYGAFTLYTSEALGTNPHYDSNPIDDNGKAILTEDITTLESFELGATAFRRIFIEGDPLLDGAPAAKQAMSNYIAMVTIPLSGEAILLKGHKVAKIMEALEILSDLDDASVSLSDGGKSALEKAGFRKETIDVVKFVINASGTVRGGIDAMYSARKVGKTDAGRSSVIKNTAGGLSDEKTAIEKYESISDDE